MSTLFKLVVTAFVLNACVQLGRSTWTYFQFQDAVQQAVLFSTNQTAEQLKVRVSEIARDLQVPVDPQTVSVTFQNVQARITASYVDNVRLVPGGYVYKWTHAMDLDMRRMAY
jgi:DNA-binding transcriptional regulator YbjK